jgi:hypothetical protein
LVLRSQIPDSYQFLGKPHRYRLAVFLVALLAAQQQLPEVSLYPAQPPLVRMDRSIHARMLMGQKNVHQTLAMMTQWAAKSRQVNKYALKILTMMAKLILMQK